MRRFVALNEEGKRIGETHPKSTIPDEVVDLIRELHEDRGWSYQRIAMKLHISVIYIGKLCRYERRVQIPEKWVRVDENGKRLVAEGSDDGLDFSPLPRLEGKTVLGSDTWIMLSDRPITAGQIRNKK